MGVGRDMGKSGVKAPVHRVHASIKSGARRGRDVLLLLQVGEGYGGAQIPFAGVGCGGVGLPRQVADVVLWGVPASPAGLKVVEEEYGGVVGDALITGVMCTQGGVGVGVGRSVRVGRSVGLRSGIRLAGDVWRSIRLKCDVRRSIRVRSRLSSVTTRT